MPLFQPEPSVIFVTQFAAVNTIGVVKVTCTGGFCLQSIPSVRVKVTVPPLAVIFPVYSGQFPSAALHDPVIGTFKAFNWFAQLVAPEVSSL